MRNSSRSRATRALVRSFSSSSASVRRAGWSSVPSQRLRSAFTERTSFCSSAFTAWARTSGRATSTPCWIRGAVTMKMMRSTSITSTSGVTLISVRVWRPEPPVPEATGGSSAEEVPLHDVEEVVGEVGHLAVEDPDARDEEVVEDHRRDGGEEAHRGGDERLGDGAGHGREVRVAHLVDVVEGPHDPPDRPEQPDEGGGAGGGPEEGHHGLEVGDLGGGGALEGALHVLDAAELLAHRRLAPLLAGGDLGELDVAGAEDRGDGARRERLGRLVDGVE